MYVVTVYEKSGFLSICRNPPRSATDACTCTNNTVVEFMRIIIHIANTIESLPHTTQYLTSRYNQILNVLQLLPHIMTFIAKNVFLRKYLKYYAGKIFGIIGLQKQRAKCWHNR